VGTMGARACCAAALLQMGLPDTSCYLVFAGKVCSIASRCVM
jgi:hypothetical protein